MRKAIRPPRCGSEKKRLQEHVRHFLHKTCNQEVSGSFKVVVVQHNGKEMYKKSVNARAKLLFC